MGEFPHRRALAIYGSTGMTVVQLEFIDVDRISIDDTHTVSVSFACTIVVFLHILYNNSLGTHIPQVLLRVRWPNQWISA